MGQFTYLVGLNTGISTVNKLITVPHKSMLLAKAESLFGLSKDSCAIEYHNKVYDAYICPSVAEEIPDEGKVRPVPLRLGCSSAYRGQHKMLATQMLTMFDLIFAVSLLLNTLQLLRAATPAPDPWRAHRGPPPLRDGRPAALPPAAGLAAQPRAIPVTGHVTNLSHSQQPAGGGGGAPRRRGRRGGVQWRRHGDIGDQHLIIGQLNVQSLLPKLPDIRVDINDRFSFDVFILSETWLKPSIPDRLVNVAGYTIIRQDRQRTGRLASGHGGVAICVRESFATERLPTPVTNVPNSNLEIVWAAIRVGKHRRCIVGAAYRVPTNTVQQASADLEDFEAQLQHMITTHPGLTIVIGGDMNCCLLKTGSNTPGERLSALLAQHGLQTCNTRQAFYRPAGSLLDILATNRSDLVTRAGVTRCHYGTPHDITRLALRVNGIKKRSGTVTQRRCFARVDKADFNQQLLNADWTPVYRSAGPELKWSAFVQTFKPLLDAVAPVRRVLVRPPGAPPASENTRHLLARRRTALSAGHRQEYKELNRQSRAAIRTDCRRHLQHQLAKGGPSSMWRVLRPMIGSSKNSAPISGITADALTRALLGGGV